MSRKQTRHNKLIIGLLQSRTVAEAARAVGMTERHVWRLLETQAFQSQLGAAQERVFAAALGRVQAALVDATDVLLEIVNCKEAAPSVRVAAARTLLEAALHSWEIRNMDRRLAALEKQNENPT
jgi:hypothetical protein